MGAFDGAAQVELDVLRRSRKRRQRKRGHGQPRDGSFPHGIPRQRQGMPCLDHGISARTISRSRASAARAGSREDRGWTTRISSGSTPAPIPPLQDPNPDGFATQQLRAGVEDCVTGFLAFVRGVYTAGDPVLDEYRKLRATYAMGRRQGQEIESTRVHHWEPSCGRNR
jgi:hypothetical protein